MLYERWRGVVEVCPNQVALWDAGSGQRWTFRELDQWAGSVQPGAGPVVFPRSGSVQFIVEVVRAWRDGLVICPLEIGQPTPAVGKGLPREIAHLKTTSATTGLPRLVAFTAEQIAADAENIVLTMGLRREWPNLGVISLAHSYGFSSLVTPLLLHGIPLILAGSALPETVRRAAETFEFLTLPAVPALWRAWLEAGAIPTNLRLAISAGAPLPLALEQEIFSRTGTKVHNFYGSSECGGIAYDLSAEPRTDAACVGAPMKNVEVSSAADGCLEVRSGAVGQTYWPEPSEHLADGRFRAGDLGEVTGDLVYLRGRATDQINVAGRKVSPESIERAILDHPAVREALVFGVPSPEDGRGEVIVATCALAGTANVETIKQHVMGRLPAWQVPRDWWLVESLEANHRGKMSRAEWRMRYLAAK